MEILKEILKQVVFLSNFSLSCFNEKNLTYFHFLEFLVIAVLLKDSKMSLKKLNTFSDNNHLFGTKNIANIKQFAVRPAKYILNKIMSNGEKA